MYNSHCFAAQSPPCELEGEDIVDESGLELLECLAGELSLEILPEQILDQPRLLGGQQLLGVGLHIGNLGQDVDKLLRLWSNVKKCNSRKVLSSFSKLFKKCFLILGPLFYMLSETRKKK